MDARLDRAAVWLADQESKEPDSNSTIVCCHEMMDQQISERRLDRRGEIGQAAGRSDIPLPIEESPSSKDPCMNHSLVLHIRMVSEQSQLLSKFEPLHQIRLADFVHAVVTIDEIQERGDLHGNQVHLVAL